MGKTYTKRNGDVNPPKAPQTREDKRGRQEDLLGFSGWAPYSVSVKQFNGKNSK